MQSIVCTSTCQLLQCTFSKNSSASIMHIFPFHPPEAQLVLLTPHLCIHTLNPFSCQLSCKQENPDNYVCCMARLMDKKSYRQWQWGKCMAWHTSVFVMILFYAPLFCILDRVHIIDVLLWCKKLLIVMPVNLQIGIKDFYQAKTTLSVYYIYSLL